MSRKISKVAVQGTTSHAMPEGTQQPAFGGSLPHTLTAAGPLCDRFIEQRSTVEQQAHLFRRAFDLSASAIVIVDALAEDYPIVCTNAAFSRLTGYSEAECLGRNCRFLHSSDCDQPELETIRRALGEGTSMRATLRNYRKDGTLFWNHLAIAPLYDKDNRLTHYVGVQTDITEIKILQDRALQERDLAEKREAILKQAQMLAKAGHWEYIEAANTLTWSDEVYAIFGLDQENFPANYEGFLATVHPEDLDAVKAAFAEHLVTRQPYFIQHRILLPDGGIKHVQERCETTFDGQGWPVRSLGVVLDVTEAYDQEQEFRRLFEGMAQGVVYQDATGAITQANPAALRLLGLDYEQLTGRKSTDPAWRSIREDGSDFPGDEHPAMVALRTGQTVSDVVMGIYHPRRDETVWILINSQPEFRSEQSRPWRVFTTFTDISQVKAMENELRNQQEVLEMQVAQRTALLREQEQLYRGLVESQQDLIVRADRRHCFTFVNDAYCRFFGKKREELIGQPFAPHIHEEDLGLTLEAIKQLEQPPHRVSIEHRAPIGGGVRWIAWEGCAIWDELGRFREFQAVGRDITESKAAQQAAESASRAKTEFLAKMSHEIRTPLNAIIGFARILDRELSQSSRHAGHVRTILQSSEHLIAMANDLLDAGKIASGKIVLSVESFDLPALLREMADIFRIRAAEKGVHFLFEPALNLPSAIASDHTKLRQIIYNLLENAVKFTDAGRVVLRATIAASEVGGGSNPVLAIEIEDSGCGISRQDLPCLFDDFFQGDTGKSFGGTGLGLPICQKLLHHMGGDIRVESEHGVGTLVRCTLPFLAVQGEPNGSVTARTQPSRDVSKAAGGGLRTPPSSCDIAKLPQEFREAMRQAVDEGNMGAMRALTEQLRDSHPSLAHGLRVLADRYDYEAFEKIL
jgi:PAS domain S-box-containing protein